MQVIVGDTAASTAWKLLRQLCGPAVAAIGPAHKQPGRLCGPASEAWRGVVSAALLEVAAEAVRAGGSIGGPELASAARPGGECR